MKEKILAATRAKYPAVNLSKKRLDAIVAKLEGKVADESEIDAKLDEFNEYNPLAEMARQDDAFRNMQEKLKNTGQKKEEEGAAPANENAKADNDDTPAWAKKLMGEVESLRAEKTQSTIKSKIAEKLKDVPATYWGKRVIPASEEEMDAFITDVQTDFSQFTQEITDKGLGALGAPKSGAANQKATAAINPEIKAFADKQAAAAVKQQQ